MKKIVKKYVGYFVIFTLAYAADVFMAPRRRCWYVNQADRADACACLHAAGITKHIDSGLCGWAKAPDVCFVRWHCNWKQYARACQYANEKGITIYNNNVGY